MYSLYFYNIFPEINGFLNTLSLKYISFTKLKIMKIFLFLHISIISHKEINATFPKALPEFILLTRSTPIENAECRSLLLMLCDPYSLHSNKEERLTSRYRAIPNYISFLFLKFR